MTVVGPTPRQVRRYGESGLLLEMAPGEEPHAVAAAISALSLPGVIDVVPAACTVAVTVTDPAQLGPIAAIVRAVPRGEPARSERALVELPTVYDGPDLLDVAAAVGVPVDEVVRRHSSARYTVAFVGFAPGFAYLTGGDPTLQVARRATPRPSVPRGSVALADAYSGVYPTSSPGGWQLIGRTDVVLFDPQTDPPSPLSPGVIVRFVPRTA